MQIIGQLTVIGVLCSLATSCKSRQEKPSDAGVAPTASITKSPCVDLAEKMCSHFGKDSEMCAFVGRQAVRFRDEFCQGKLDKFAESVAELSKYQEALKLIAESVQKSWNIDAPALGPVKAPVVLTEFCDFEAPDCGRLSLLPTSSKNLYADKVRLVFRQFPLMKNPDARLAAEASLAANAQGKFWEYHDVLFNNPQDHGRDALERYAKVVGLKMADFKRALDEHTFAVDVDADKDLGKSLFISELPALFANGRLVPTPNNVPDLTKIVEEALTKRKPEPQ